MRNPLSRLHNLRGARNQLLCRQHEIRSFSDKLRNNPSKSKHEALARALCIPGIKYINLATLKHTYMHITEEGTHILVLDLGV